MADLNSTIVRGNLRVTDDINTSGTITGNGSGLTNLNASNIGSGTLNADRLATSGATAGSYGPSANAEPGYGSTFNVPYITVDNKGRVTAASTKTVKIPASDNTNTASAVDNILDGSNSGTAITYAPYTTQQNKLSFDTSTTAPSRTDRLNLNGYLYTTNLNTNSIYMPIYYSGDLVDEVHISTDFDDDAGDQILGISGADKITCNGYIFVISNGGFLTTNDSGIFSNFYSSTTDNCTKIYSYNPSGEGYTPIKAECSSFSITNPANSWTLTFPTTTGKVLATNGSVGSSTAPVYVDSNGVVTQGSTYAGGTRLCINSSSYTSSATIYVPTSAISTSTAKRYLLGSSSTTSMATTNTNSSCYMSSGSIYATYFYGTSDQRLKENIKDLDLNCLDLVNNINLREFSWKSDKKHKPTVGAIAQELRQILPEKYVHEFIGGKETDDEYLSINDSKLVYLLIGAIQEQQKEIEQLKKEAKDKIV